LGRVRRHLVRALFSRSTPLLALAALAMPSSVLARTARVPEDFPTIQAAVDYVEQFHATDTVLVQAGTYPEHVMITREDIRLLGVQVPGRAEPMVRIDELRVQPPASGVGIHVIGVHVDGPAVTLPCDGPEQVYYESCRFDNGMVGGNWYPDIWVISMRHCTLFGTIALAAKNTIVDSCMVYGPLDLMADEAAVVTANHFQDVPGFAASVFCEQRVNIARNVVRGGVGAF
jgi:hypothetical protein